MKFQRFLTFNPYDLSIVLEFQKIVYATDDPNLLIGNQRRFTSSLQTTKQLCDIYTYPYISSRAIIPSPVRLFNSDISRLWVTFRGRHSA